MKVKETDQTNQASSLEQLIAEVKQVETEENTEATLRRGFNKEIKIDVLSLPPRSEVHNTKQRARIRISRPMKRLIFILTVVVILISGSIYYFSDELFDLFSV